MYKILDQFPELMGEFLFIFKYLITHLLQLSNSDIEHIIQSSYLTVYLNLLLSPPLPASPYSFLTLITIILPNCGDYYSTFSMRWTVSAPTLKWDQIQEEEWALTEMVLGGRILMRRRMKHGINWRLKPRHNCETRKRRNRRNTSGNQEERRFGGQVSKLPRDKIKIRQIEPQWSIRFLAQRNNQPGSIPKVGQKSSWLFI